MLNSAKKIMELESQLAEKSAENDALRAVVEQQGAELKILKQKLRYVLGKMFGTKSEKLNPNQLEFLFNMDEFVSDPEQEESAPVSPEPPKARKRTPRKDKLPDDLPVEEIFIDPDEVIEHPSDYRCIGEERHEELDVEPARFTRRVIVRRKYVKKGTHTEAPIIAPARPRLFEKSFASVSLLVYVLIAKYVDHLPLYRQEMILKTRHGIELSRQTMSGWMWGIAHWLSLIYDEMKKEILESGYVQIDETVIKYLQPGSGRAQTGYLWVYNAPGKGVIFDWHTGRGADCLESMLGEYDGAVQSDGYQAYQAYNRWRVENGKSQLDAFACWAHVRRYFFEAKDESYFARWMLRQIQLLYQIETQLRNEKAGPKLRAAVRQAQSAMILNRIEKALKIKLFAHLPKSSTGRAIAYTLHLWPMLTRYTQAGQVEIDNNLVENTIRPTALGKKNWLFFGSEKAGWQSAVIYSILETCRKVGINPWEYLTDVLTRLPHLTSQQARELTPAKWLKARQKAAA